MRSAEQSKSPCLAEHLDIRFSGDFGFIQTWNIGVEGFSKTAEMPEMNPILGGKREYLWLIGFLGLIPLIGMGRKANEDALRAQVKATNRYARMNLDSQSRQLSKL